MKFEVDFMLGKLARILRLLGFDTKYIKYVGAVREPPLDFGVMKEGRILLTRAHNLPKMETIFIIQSEHLETQLKEIDAKFNIKFKLRPFTRCIVCNTLLTPVDKSQVKDRVPFYVYQTQNEFVYCKGCDKFYWKGTHYKNMLSLVKKIEVSL